MRHSPLHRAFVRSLLRNGRPVLRLAASNEVEVGPLAPRKWAAGNGGEAA